MSININSNIVIVGGGVAGLWLANLCKNLNYDFILLEKNQLGSGQTIQSQGIIHGGLKYALGGKLSDSSESIRNMPAIWQACLENKGQIPLSQVKILSNNQFLWSTGILDNMSNFFASKNLSSRVTKLSRSYYPSILQTKDFVGSVYKLEELVLDIQSVLHSLAKNVEHHLAKIDAIQVNTCLNNNKNIQHLSTIINNQKFTITAKYYIFTAGNGNAELCKNISPDIQMQQRPLQQLILKSPDLPKIFAHKISTSLLPIATITSHVNKNNIPVWYVGGEIAEQGINKSKTELIMAGKKLIHTFFPWLSLNTITWGSCIASRAEAKQAKQEKPDSITCFERGNAIVAWPTKLAFAPLLAEKICALIKLAPSNSQSNILANLPKPSIADYPWDEEKNYES